MSWAVRQTEVTRERGTGAEISQVLGGANEADEGQVCSRGKLHPEEATPTLMKKHV